MRTHRLKEKPTSFTLLPYVQMYGYVGRMLAKYNINSVGLLLRKISSFLWPVKDGLGLNTPGVIADPVSVARCTLDKLVNAWRPG
jgi:hypothetical protein